MKWFYHEDLLGNKLVALALVIIFNITVEYVLAIVPIVMFFCIPTALVLIFTNEKFV